MKIINLLEGGQSGTEEMDPGEQLNKKNSEAMEKPPTLRWFLTKLSYLASYEASKEQKICIKVHLISLLISLQYFVITLLIVSGIIFTDMVVIFN